MKTNLAHLPRQTAAMLAYLVLVLGLPVYGLAQTRTAGPGESELGEHALTYSEILADIETLRVLHMLELTAEQAETIFNLTAPICALADTVHEYRNSRATLDALLDVRAAVAAGQPLQGDLLVRFNQARALPPQLQQWDNAWQLTRDTGLDVARELTSEQVDRLAFPYLRDQAAQILSALGQARILPPAEWMAWRQQTIAQWVANVNSPAPDLADKLGAVLDQGRALTPDDWFARQDALAAALVAALRPNIPDQERLQRAAEWFAHQLQGNLGFDVCLQEYLDYKKGSATPTSPATAPAAPEPGPVPTAPGGPHQ